MNEYEAPFRQVSNRYTPQFNRVKSKAEFVKQLTVSWEGGTQHARYLVHILVMLNIHHEELHVQTTKGAVVSYIPSMLICPASNWFPSYLAFFVLYIPFTSLLTITTIPWFQH